MGFISEFKEFALKGNVLDLAVGVIIGGAFGKIVDSAINDLIMPWVGIIFQADFSNLYIPLSSKITPGLALIEAKKLGPVFAWGSFITVALNFIIMALVVFMIVKAMNSMRKAPEAAPAATPEPSSTDKLLMEIRDSLKK